MDRYLTATEVKKIYTLGLSSLKYWESRGILRPLKTPGGHRRYSEQEIQSMLGSNKVLRGKRCAVYARVSTQKQANSGSLDRHIQQQFAGPIIGYWIISMFKR